MYNVLYESSNLYLNNFFPMPGYPMIKLTLYCKGSRQLDDLLMVICSYLSYKTKKDPSAY